LSEKISVDFKRYLFGRVKWLVYFLLGLCLIFSLFYLASYFGLSFFVLSNRGMVEHTVSGNLISNNSDLAIWVCSAFGIIAWLLYGLISSRIDDFFRVFAGIILLGLTVWVGLIAFGMVSLVSLVLVSLLLISLVLGFSMLFFGISRVGLLMRLLLGSVLVVVCVEATSLVLFNVPVALNIAYGVNGLHWNNVDLSFSNLTYPFLPYVYMFLILLGLVGFVIKTLPVSCYFKIKGKQFEIFLDRLRSSSETRNDSGFKFLTGRFVLVVAVFVGAIASFLFVTLTVLPWFNPTDRLVSVDSPLYYQWIVYMRSVNVNSALSFAFGNERALFLILGYALSYIVSPLIMIQFVAALLIVMFGIVCLLVFRLFGISRVIWVLGVLLVPLSFQALGLIYSGYFANMLALILVSFYLILFFKVLNSWSSLGFFGLIVISILVMLSHTWTWFIFALSLGAFLFLEGCLTLNDRSRWSKFKEKIVLIVATIGVGLSVDIVRGFLSSVSSSASLVYTVHSGLSFPNGVFLFAAMQKNVDFALGGVFANGLLVFLSVAGFLFLLRLKSGVANFFVSWVFVACVSILFAAQDFVFNRFLFLMPSVILSSFGLFSVLQFAFRYFDSRKGSLVCLAILVFVFLTLLNCSLRYLFNINIV
jgi:hypothetical protein